MCLYLYVGYRFKKNNLVKYFVACTFSKLTQFTPFASINIPSKRELLIISAKFLALYCASILDLLWSHHPPNHRWSTLGHTIHPTNRRSTLDHTVHSTNRWSTLGHTIHPTNRRSTLGHTIHPIKRLSTLDHTIHPTKRLSTLDHTIHLVLSSIPF